MRIGELARRTGLTRSRIRYYERIGLLRAGERLPNGYRTYPEDAVTLLGLVLVAQDAGFSLDEIQLLAPQDLAGWDHQLLTATLTRKIAQIEAQQRQLADSKALLETIATAMASRPDGMDCTSNSERIMSLAMLGRSHVARRLDRSRS